MIYALLMKKEVVERLLTMDVRIPQSDEASLPSLLKSHSIDTLKSLFRYLDPQLQSLEKHYEQVTETEVVKLLTETTVVGVVPPPHHILVHRYRGNADTRSWLQTFVWAVVYVNQPVFQLSNSSGIRLFEIKSKE